MKKTPGLLHLRLAQHQVSWCSTANTQLMPTSKHNVSAPGQSCRRLRIPRETPAHPAPFPSQAGRRTSTALEHESSSTNDVSCRWDSFNSLITNSYSEATAAAGQSVNEWSSRACANEIRFECNV